MSDYILELQEDLRKTRKMNHFYEAMTFGILFVANLLAFSFAGIMIYKVWVGQ
jgi:hypothetical protein